MGVGIPRKRDEATLEKRVNTYLRKQLSGPLASFITAQIKLNQKKFRGRRYDEDLKLFAITVYHASATAYKCISKLFYLPSISSLKRWLQSFDIQPGINEHVLSSIKTKASGMSDIEKDCILCMDEMSVKKNVLYDMCNDKLVGVEDLGEGKRCIELAGAALVMMVKGINSKWKQPISFYLINTSFHPEKLQITVQTILRRLSETELRVYGVVTDMGSNFVKMSKNLGVTKHSPYFRVDGKKYFYMFDVPHLLKSMRNNLMKYDVKFCYEGTTQKASWKHIEAFYEKDSKLNFRITPKLTPNHLYPSNFTKMKVRYASQIFSHSVAAALYTHVSLKSLPPEAASTADFLLVMDKLFDCLNSSSFSTSKPLKKPIEAKTRHVEYLESMLCMFNNLVYLERRNEVEVDVTNRIKCISGWVITIEAFLQLWQTLQCTRNQKFLLTRRFNQDCLENFFGQIRQQNGNTDNPTCLQFGRTFKKLFYKSYLSDSNVNTGNCEIDFDTILMEVRTQSPSRNFIKRAVARKCLLPYLQSSFFS